MFLRTRERSWTVISSKVEDLLSTDLPKLAVRALNSSKGCKFGVWGLCLGSSFRLAGYLERIIQSKASSLDQLCCCC